jgi:hypothetical protein
MIKRRQMAVAYVRSPGYFKAHQRNLNLLLHTCLHTSNHSPAGLIGWRWWLLWVFEMGLQGRYGNLRFRSDYHNRLLPQWGAEAPSFRSNRDREQEVFVGEFSLALVNSTRRQAVPARGVSVSAE